MSKVSSSQHRVLIRRLMEWDSSRIIGGGWLEDWLIHVKRFVVWFSVGLLGTVIEIIG